MERETKGQNLILIIILVFILILAYSVVPMKPGETSKKKHTYRKWILRSELVNGKLPAPKVVEEEAVAEEMEEPAAEEEMQAEAEPAHESAESEEKEAPKAAEEPPPVEEGVLLMNESGYAKHTKPLVKFTHQKHIDSYSKGCGDCHHDSEGAPLELAPGDEITACIECHSETQMKKGEKLSPEEKIATYHKEALHANCIGCHKAYNIENGDPKGRKPAPASCNQCHEKG